MGNIIYLQKGGNDMERKVSIFDVANYFLSLESMTNKKLQKLCYYAQSWHLALFKEPLFDEKFEAWVHGPVCRKLYNVYKDHRWNPITKLDEGDLLGDEEMKEFIQTIFNTYGKFDGDELEVLTHSELPWKKAREGLEEWEPSTEHIDENIMESFYWNIYVQDQNY